MADYIKQVKIDEVVNGVHTPKVYDVYDKSALHALPDNIVTTDGVQTISGAKTFSSDIKVGSSSIGKNGYIEGTWLKTTATTDNKGNFATLNGGWIYYRTPAEVLGDIGGASTAQVQAAQDAAEAAAQDAADAMTEAGTKQNKLTGTAGQVVGFDANGNAVAQDLSAPTPYTVVTATLNKSSNVTTTSISGYANDWYVAVSGLTTSSTFEVLVNSTSADVINQFKQLGFARCSTNDRLTFACRLKPTVNVPIVVRIYS